jgi:DNA-binding transcriptional LysR family regulator
MIPLEDFVAASHVSMGDSPTKTITIETILDHELQALGQRRCIVAHSPTHSAVAQIVASSDLLAILPARLAQDYVRHMPLRIFPPPFPLPTFHVTMMWHERSQKDPGHIWLREQFKKVGASLADVVSSR